MIYLYIGKNEIKLLSLSKTILGQYNVSLFEKKHESDLLEDGKVKNVDVLASAIKEALTLASPKEITERQVFLILPQEAFDFRSYDLPADISDTAILPFIKDKVRPDISYNIDEGVFDYFVTKQVNESKVQFFSQDQNTIARFSEVFKILDLSLESVFPETLSFYKLFEKTLKLDKKENILYVFFEKNNSFSYLYDSLGLVKGERVDLGKDVETSLKTRIEKLAKEDMKIDRVILSGEESKKVRQDHFTKNVGAWTNPLEKIISTFYREYLKLIILPKGQTMDLLNFDVALGAFIFNRENGEFANPSGKKISLTKVKQMLPSVRLPLFKKTEEKEPDREEAPRFKSFSRRDLSVFVIAFAIGFFVIYLLTTKAGPFKLSQKSSGDKKISLPGPFSKPSSTPTPRPPTPTPTPSFKKETLKIKILNGSGTAGKAGELKAILQDKSYKEIISGNADNFDYETSEIAVKDNMKAAAEAVKKDLEDEIKITKVTSLEDDSSADLVITIGADFK